MKVRAKDWRFVRSVVALLALLTLGLPFASNALAAVGVHSEAHFNRITACTTTGLTSNTFGVISGDLIWVIVNVVGTGAAAATPSDTSQAGLSWHAVAATQCAGAAVGVVQMYWAVSGATETDQVKEITSVGAVCAIDALDLSGASTTTPVAQYTTCNNGSSTSPATQNFSASTASTSLEIGGLMTNAGYTYVSGPTNSYTTLTEYALGPGSLGAYNTGQTNSNGYGFGISASIAWNGFAAEVRALIAPVAVSGSFGNGGTVIASRAVRLARAGSFGNGGIIAAGRAVKAWFSALIEAAGAIIAGVIAGPTIHGLPFVVSNAPIQGSFVAASPIKGTVIFVVPMKGY